MQNNPVLKEIISKIRTTVPEKCGAYVFMDSDDRILYIGKSVNLRKRMLSYFYSKWKQGDSKAQRLRYQTSNFTYYATYSELLALLLEDALIKMHTPQFNDRLNEIDQYRYLLLTEDSYPTLQIVESDQHVENQLIFGPFKDQYLANDILQLIYRYIHLRACTDQTPFRKSMNFELGLCTGPCRAAITIAEYAEIVHHTVDFLNGEKSFVTAKIKSDIKSLSHARDFEKAQKTKDELDFALRFCKRQKFINNFKSNQLLIREDSKSESTYAFNKGKLIHPPTMTPDSTNEKQWIDPDNKDQYSDARFLLDRANIVYNWVHSKNRQCSYYFQ